MTIDMDREIAPGIESDRAYEIRGWAAQIYHENLLKSSEALAYQLNVRRRSEGILKQFRVGVGRRNLMARAKEDGWSVEDLMSVGLVMEGKRGPFEALDGGEYIYPIWLKGRVAFFNRKQPPGSKKQNYQIQGQFRPPGVVAVNQDVVEKAEAFTLVEGFNDLLTLYELGEDENVVATLGPSTESECREWLRERCAGKTIFMAFDINDEPNPKTGKIAGQEYRKKYTADVIKAGGKPRWPEWPEGDIDDYLRGCIAPGVEWAQIKAEAIDILPGGKGKDFFNPYEFDSFEILCELPDGRLAFWNRYKKCIYKIPLDKLNLDALVQIGGRDVAFRVARNDTQMQNARDEGRVMVSFTQVKKRMICQAGDNRFSSFRELGQGIHEVAGRMILVNGGEACRYDPTEKRLLPVSHPMVAKNKILKLNEGMEILPFKELADAVEKMTRSRAQEAIAELRRILKAWHFAGPLDTDMFVGFVLAQIVQDIWDWRPQLWLTGGSSTGKSKINYLVRDLFPNLVSYQHGQSLTEPGFRQAIGAQKSMVLLDEFEASQARQKILDLLRSAGGGNTKVIAQPNQEPILFHIRHSVMVTSIEVGMEAEADLNRFIVLSTKRLDKENVEMVMPSSADLRKLRRELLAFAIRAAYGAREVVREHATEMDRIQESALVPMAMLCQATGENPWEKMTAYLKTAQTNMGDIRDEERMMAAIMDYPVKVTIEKVDAWGHAKDALTELSIAQILGDSMYDADIYNNAVETRGVKRENGRDSIFIYPEGVKRYVLRGTSYKDFNPKEILMRIDGAEWGRARIAGKQPWGIWIPTGWLEERGLLLRGGDDGTFG